MPTPTEILNGLTAIANDHVVIAILWHVAILAALVALALGWRPRLRLAASLLAAPLASVAALAFVHGNPFNGVLLGAGALALVAFALAARTGDEPLAAGAPWTVAAAAALIAFAWTYPHFLARGGWLGFLYAAPVGLVPCPTLALVAGLALLADGLDRRIAAGLAALAAFYGLFGVLRLGVQLDLGLLAGAVALAVVAVRPAHPAGHGATPLPRAA